MKKQKNKQHQLNKSNQQKRKKPKYSNSRNLAGSNSITPQMVQSKLPVRNLVTQGEVKQKEIEKRRINAEIRTDWLENYDSKLSSLHHQIFEFSEGNTDIGVITVKYIDTNCEDYLPVGITSEYLLYVESHMHVKNYAIKDIFLGFKSIQFFQQLVKTAELEQSYYHSSRLHNYLASLERTIQLVQKCDYSTHRVILVDNIEAILVPLSSLEKSIFDEHDPNWVCSFAPDHICVGNLEKCLDFCNYIDEYADKALMKKVCLHTGRGDAIFSDIEWNPLEAENFRNEYKDYVAEDGFLIVPS